MKRYIARHLLMARLAALALLTLCLVQTQVRAQEEASFVFHAISWGMGHGETARFTVSNPKEPAKTELTRQVTIVVDLLDAHGALIAQSDEIDISPGAFRSVDLPVAGEPGMGRVQTRARVRYRTFSIIDRSQLTVFSPSIELIDNSTGRTTAVWLTVGFFEVVTPQKPQ